MTKPICKTFVVKIASRCNLNCTYCYMYNMGDETYKLQPKKMSDDVIVSLFEKAKQHCIENKMDKFTFVLHGGEPLLVGIPFLKKFMSFSENIFGGTEIKPIFFLQTNGLLLNDEWCKIIEQYNLHLGISLDGLKEDNDKYRIDHKGKGSYNRIIKGINIAKNNNLNLGLLSVINIESNPKEIYENFKDLNIDSTDFLLPESTYQQLPLRPEKGKLVNSETPYGDWLIELFDIWFNDHTSNRLTIRKFEQYVRSILGADINGDDMGNSHNEVLVVETNGDFEAVDALKVCGNGFTKTSANVKETSISEALATELAEQYYYSHFNLPMKCLACPINETCGGGYIPHRYDVDNGFNNPSVYCKDLLKLITHIQNVIVNELEKKTSNEFIIEKITYERALDMIEENAKKIENPYYINHLEKFRKTEVTKIN
jgi:uncharacterized protein